MPMLKAERISCSGPKLSDAQTRNFEAIKHRYTQGDVADGGGQAPLTVAVARVRPVLAQHIRLRVHRLLHHRLGQGPGVLPHVEEPVAVGRELP